MTLLVTGGAGFIGSNFILDWFQYSNETIINLDKLTYSGNILNLKSLDNDGRYIFKRGDILIDTKVNENLETYSPRAIINFAAESHVDRSIESSDVFSFDN